MKSIIADLSYSALAELIVRLGGKKYRAEQIYQGIMADKKISEMNIDARLKTQLLNEFEDTALTVIKELKSSDGTIKFLLGLADGSTIECVIMKYDYGNTVCVSTQVGCRMGCAFCASGVGGLVRNLSSGEILSQVILANKYLGGSRENRKITNIVLMGSGEPLDNYDNVVSFIRNVNFEKGLNISTRNISLSTCGLVKKIYELADEGFGVNLTISLHSPLDSERIKIMPIAKVHSISEILKACDYFFKKTGRRYIFEYTLIKGSNDRAEDIAELASILKGRPCHLNLILLNAVKESGLLSTTKKDAYRFMGELEKLGISVSLRRQIGADIEGACGQLRNKFVGDKQP